MNGNKTGQYEEKQDLSKVKSSSVCCKRHSLPQEHKNNAGFRMKLESEIVEGLLISNKGLGFYSIGTHHLLSIDYL